MRGERHVGGMRCSEVLDGLSAYLDGELPPEVVRRVEDHLRGCSVCEQFGGSMGGMVKALRVKLHQDIADEKVQRNLLSALNAEMKKRSGP